MTPGALKIFHRYSHLTLFNIQYSHLTYSILQGNLNIATDQSSGSKKSGSIWKFFFA